MDLASKLKKLKTLMDEKKLSVPSPKEALTDAFGFRVTKRTRKRAAEEGYDVIVIRGVAYFVDIRAHQAFCE